MGEEERRLNTIFLLVPPLFQLGFLLCEHNGIITKHKKGGKEIKGGGREGEEEGVMYTG